MNFFRAVRGNFACFKPIGDFNASTLVHFKKAITNDLTDGKLDLAIDLRKTNSIDHTGLRFLFNLSETLRKIKRRLVFFGAQQSVVDELLETKSDWEVFRSLAEFEKSFHEIPADLAANFFELASGTGQIRTLDLMCPVCGNERIQGFIDTERQYALEWVDTSITPIYSYLEDPENEINPERYRVAVCQECLFASNRLDWFDVRLPEGIMESRLTEEQVEFLANRIQQRKSLYSTFPSLDQPHFFGLPRETKAAYLSWMLNEMTYRDIARDKTSTDAFQMAYCHFMMCNFTEDDEKISAHIDSALAWLSGLLNNQERYASYRVLQGMVYIISVYLYKGQFGEVLKLEKQLMKKFSDEPDAGFWIGRVKELIEEEKSQMENLG